LADLLEVCLWYGSLLEDVSKSSGEGMEETARLLLPYVVGCLENLSKVCGAPLNFIESVVARLGSILRVSFGRNLRTKIEKGSKLKVCW
jgi:hypothetical protein